MSTIHLRRVLAANAEISLSISSEISPKLRCLPVPAKHFRWCFKFCSNK